MTEREKIIDVLNKNFTQDVECTPIYTTAQGKEVALPLPDFTPKNNEEKMLVAIKLYSEAGAEEIKRLEAENAALRERLDKAVDKTIVSEMLAKYFDCPCNFSPLDEEMWAYCRDNCVDDNIECWIRVINKKCAELKGEKE